MEKVCRKFAESLQKVCRKFAESLQKVCRKFAESLQKVCRKFAESLQKVCTKFAESLHKVCRVCRKFAKTNSLQTYSSFDVKMRLFAENPTLDLHRTAHVGIASKAQFFEPLWGNWVVFCFGKLH